MRQETKRSPISTFHTKTIRRQ